MKDVLRCNADTMSTQALQICNETSMDPKNCHFWLTDNTAYMASKTGGAVAKFNKISQSQSFRIPCGLHAVHIALMNFENAAFGKIDAIKGLSLKEHPYNVLNLAFYLHDGYDLSDKDNPLNLKASVIRNLYKILFDYDLTKYQQPIRQRWLYELKTAKQYLERHEIHKQFAQYFLEKLNMASNFLTNYDPVPQIYGSDGVECLPAGNRAHEMPDMTLMWIEKLQNNVENIFDLFGEELYETESFMPSDDFNNLCESLRTGVEQALNGFIKWMGVWIHLPLSICSLGGNHGSEYASAFLQVFYSCSESYSLTLQESLYVKYLQQNIVDQNQNTFSLLEALSDQNFFDQFNNFANSDGQEPWKFPLVYEFIKYQIYSIVIHQQQLEGLFNCYDIKIHPNMGTELQQARIQISGINNRIEKVTQDELHHIRKEMRNSNRRDNSLESSLENAQDILNTFLTWRKK
ncbi:unnamed protein product [Rhizophagus irregularis]|nr:unnamed protein product [Rhizophagus irregularis]